jgi:hypothetical protein
MQTKGLRVVSQAALSMRHNTASYSGLKHTGSTTKPKGSGKKGRWQPVEEDTGDFDVSLAKLPAKSFHCLKPELEPLIVHQSSNSVCLGEVRVHSFKLVETVACISQRHRDRYCHCQGGSRSQHLYVVHSLRNGPRPPNQCAKH